MGEFRTQGRECEGTSAGSLQEISAKKWEAVNLSPSTAFPQPRRLRLRLNDSVIFCFGIIGDEHTSVNTRWRHHRIKEEIIKLH